MQVDTFGVNLTRYKLITRILRTYLPSKVDFYFIDELLEDLQSTVAPRPAVNGHATGYRQTYKTFTTQKSGYPAETSKECEIEYLNPSNMTSVVAERSKSPLFDKVSFNSSKLRTSKYGFHFVISFIITTGEYFDQWQKCFCAQNYQLRIQY